MKVQIKKGEKSASQHIEARSVIIEMGSAKMHLSIDEYGFLSVIKEGGASSLITMHPDAGNAILLK